MLGGCLMVGR